MNDREYSNDWSTLSDGEIWARLCGDQSPEEWAELAGAVEAKSLEAEVDIYLDGFGREFSLTPDEHTAARAAMTRMLEPYRHVIETA